jgi:hypothetical protein
MNSWWMLPYTNILYYSETCPRRNLNKAETCSMWTNSIVPARRIGITVLFILYNTESAHRANGKQYLKNLLKITCIRRKVFWRLYCLYCFVWELMLVSFRQVLYTAIIHKAGPYLSLYCIERGLWMIFLTINAHNRMLDVTCHRNLESAYLTMLSRYSVTEQSGREREREREGGINTTLLTHGKVKTFQ